MCKYVFTRGDKAGESCQVGGKDKYLGYCKRHYERTMKTKVKSKPIDKVFDNNVRNNIRDFVINSVKNSTNNNVKNNSNIENNHDDYDPFPPLINKYQMKLIPDYGFVETDENDNNDDFVNISTKNKTEKTERLYEQYKEACDIKGDEAIDYDDFNENDYLRDVAEELENMNAPKFDESFIKDCLFNLNLVAFTGIEQGSQILKEMYPEKELTDLTGLTRDVYEEEELYKKVLYDIYKENYEIIDLYLSPVTIYGLLSLKSIGVRYARNKKKA